MSWRQRFVATTSLKNIYGIVGGENFSLTSNKPPRSRKMPYSYFIINPAIGCYVFYFIHLSVLQLHKKGCILSWRDKGSSFIQKSYATKNVINQKKSVNSCMLRCKKKENVFRVYSLIGCSSAFVTQTTLINYCHILKSIVTARIMQSLLRLRKQMV